jgi:hypothetical protein
MKDLMTTIGSSSHRLVVTAVIVLYALCSSCTLLVATDINNNDNTHILGIKENDVHYFKSDLQRRMTRFDAKIIVNMAYSFNSVINCTIDSTKAIKDTVGSLKIVSSYFDYSSDNISSAKDYAWWFYSDEKNSKKASYRIGFDWNGLFNNYYDLHTIGSGYQIKPLYEKRFETNGTIYDPDQYLFMIIALNKDDPAVITGISSLFSLDPIMVNITLDSTEYVGGQSMNVTVNSQDGLGYYKVFQVPYSYKNDPLLFNNATVVKWNLMEEQSDLLVTITWNKPGLYQVVLFSPYGEIIRGISEVFQVKQFDRKTNSTSIVLDKKSYSHLESMILSITVEVNTPPINSRGFVTFYRWNATVKDSCDYNDNPYVGGLQHNGTLRYGYRHFLWNTTSTTIHIESVVSWLEGGWYKAVFYTGTTCQSFRIVSSPPFQLKKLPMRIEMPKRRYYRGETMTLSAISPYTYLTNKTDLTERDPYPFMAIPAHVIHGVTSGYWRTVQIYSYKLNTLELDPGLYKIAIYSDGYRVGINYLMSVSNSTFAVLENQLLVSTDKKEYNQDDTLVVSVTTFRNVTLSGTFLIKISADSIYNPTIQNDIDYKHAIEYGNSTSTQVSFNVNWCVSCNAKKYTVQVFYPTNYTSPAATTEFMVV